MKVEIMEAMIKRIQNSGVIGTRSVYIEDGVPKGTGHPQTTIGYASMSALSPAQSGTVRKYSFLFGVNSITSAATAGSMTDAIEESDAILELFEAKQFGVTLANGKQIQVQSFLSGGTLFKDLDKQEWIAQHLYEIIHG
jgi:hypothetical protein